MKLKDVPYLTWVQHNGKPYHVRDRCGEEIILRDSAKNDIWLSIDEDVELIDVPVFNIGDLVLYQGWVLSLYGKLLQIVQYDGSTYAPYLLGGSVWATPFEITKIDY
jgi:hypothetical protein